jgi:PadR family transcriptional regulator PadR
MAAPKLDDDNLARFQKELLTGTVSLLLLSLLEKAEEPLYGYQIARRFEVSDSADGSPDPAIKRGTLYPALRSLEARGYLESQLVASDAGPARKYYSITESGRAVAAGWKGVWRRTTALVDSILEE